MIARLWSLCGDAWTVFGALACIASEGATAVAEFAAARARGCQQRMRRAIGLPPLPRDPGPSAGEGAPR